MAAQMVAPLRIVNVSTERRERRKARFRGLAILDTFSQADNGSETKHAPAALS
jgi:hypothetical protein